MNNIDKIIEREFGGVVTTEDAGDDIATWMTAENLRTLLEEAVEPYRKDAERLDFVQSKWATIYSSHAGGKLSHWVFVDEKKRTRTGIVGESLREAIDAAIAAAEEKLNKN